MENVEYNTFISNGNVGAIVNTSIKTRPKGDTESRTEYNQLPYKEWGDQNDLPKTYREVVEKNTILSGGLPFKAAMLLSGGITAGKYRVNASGEKYFKEVLDDDFEEFKRKNNLSKLYNETFLDLVTYHNAWPQLIINNGGEISGVSCSKTRAPFCRMEKYNNSLVSENLYIHADFPDGESPGEKDCVIIPLIDDFHDPAEWLRDDLEKRPSQRHYAFRMYIPDFGNSYYSRPFWFSAKESGWTDVLEKIAALKKKLVDAHINIKFQFEVHPDYWPNRFGKEWTESNLDEKKKLIQQQVDDWDEFLQDPNVTSAVLMSGLAPNQYNTNGVFESMIRINEFKNPVSDGAFNQDSQEATLHILFAAMLHPSMFGALPGKNLGGGSGSDSRVAFNQRAIIQMATQDIILKFLEFIRDFNKWDPELCFKVKNSLVQTLDQGEITNPSPNDPGNTTTNNQPPAAVENMSRTEINTLITNTLKAAGITIGEK